MSISDTLKLSMMDIGCDGSYIQHIYDTELVKVRYHTSIVILDTEFHAYLSYGYNRYAEIC